jgi:tetratricopeptide (TPR) repeat protein
VVTALAGQAELGVRETALLGIALLRLGHYVDAEPMLRRAHLLGDLEARVEYGNLLRATGRHDEAVTLLSELESIEDDELRFRALRWRGVAEFQRGHVREGLELCERAWHGYIKLSDDVNIAKLSQNLALMHKNFGNYGRAEQLLDEAIRALEVTGDHSGLLTSLHTQLELQMSRGRLDGARTTLERTRPLLQYATPQRALYFLTSEAALAENEGEYERHVTLVREIVSRAAAIGDREVLLWSTVKLAEHHARVGDHAQAMRLVYQFPRAPEEALPVELRVVLGVIHRRRGSYRQATVELSEAVEILKERGDALGLTRAQLQLAYACHLDHQPQATAVVLRETLESLLRLHTQSALRPELEELSELLQYAALEPDLAPYLEPIMENLAGIAHGDPGSPDQIRLQVYTFGRVTVFRDGEEAHFTLRGSVPLLVYLMLRPGRTRVEMQLDLYPDKDATSSANYIRQAIKELRDRLGQDVVVFDGPHHQPRYRLGPRVRVDLDFLRFLDAVEHGEVARALAVYRGEFLPGMDDSEWVLTRRDEAQLALAFELRNQIARFREGGEWRRVILLCNQYLRIDPYEREVHQLRVEAARHVSNAAELARYVSQLKALDN